MYNNYRLPKNVAQITQKYVGVNVMPYQEKVYLNKENDFPHFIHYNSYEDQIEAIGKLIEQYDGKSIGILFYSNELVLEMSEALTNVVSIWNTSARLLQMTSEVKAIFTLLILYQRC